MHALTANSGGGQQSSPASTGYTPAFWGGGSDEIVTASATDVGGNVYVVGGTASFPQVTECGTGLCAFVAKFSPSGVVQWAKVWGGGVGEIASGVAVASGAVFVTGDTQSYGSGSTDIFLMKLSAANGASVWSSVKIWGGVQDDFASALAVATDGSIYVAATSDSTNVWYNTANSSDIRPQFAAVLLKFDATGTLSWGRSLSATNAYWYQGCNLYSPCDSMANAVTVSSDSSQIYIGGAATFGTNTYPFPNPLIVKFTNTGDLVWARELKPNLYYTPSGAAINSLALSSDGNTVYFGGYVVTKQVANVFLFLLWLYLDPCAGIGDGFSGDLLTIACTLITKYFNFPPDIPVQIATYTYALVGAEATGSNRVPTWSVTWGVWQTGNVVSALYVSASDGSVYVAGTTDAESVLQPNANRCGGTSGGCAFDSFLLKYSSSGTLQTQEIWGFQGIQPFPPSMVLSSDGGSIILAGSADAGSSFSTQSISADRNDCNGSPPPLCFVPLDITLATDSQSGGFLFLNYPCAQDPHIPVQCATSTSTTTLPASPPTGATLSPYYTAGYDAFLSRLPIPGSQGEVQPIQLIPSPSTSPPGTFALVGTICTLSPSSLIGDGNPHNIVASQNCGVTASHFNVGNSRYVFSGGLNSWSISTCGAANCGIEPSVYYYQVNNNFKINSEGTTGAFQSGLTGVFMGTYLGIASSTICTTPSTTNGVTNESCTGFSDYSTHVYAAQYLTGSLANTQWQEAGGKPKDLGAVTTLGGNYAGNYYHQVTNTFGINSEPSTGAFVTGLTGAFEGTVLGVTSSIICTTPVSTSGGTNEHCNGFSDYGAHAFAPWYLNGAAVNTQWQEANGKLKDLGALTNGGGGYGGNYYYQVKNTFNINSELTTGAFVASLKGGFSGTYLGFASTICTTPSSVAGATNQFCAGYSDYGTHVYAPQYLSGAASNTQWQEAGAKAKDLGALKTGGGNYGGNYYRQLQNTYKATPTNPSQWDGAHNIPVTGTFLGTTNSLVCTLVTVLNGGATSCSGWSDYDILVSLQTPISGTYWFAQAPYTFMDMGGGNSHNVNYRLPVTVTQAITLTVYESGAPKTSVFTLSGCNVSPTTMVGDGLSHSVTAYANCALTITVPSDANNAGVRFAAGASSYAFSTCASGTCSAQLINYYYLLKNTYTASPLVPPTWDGSYLVQVTGTVAGAVGQVVCSTNTSGGGGGVGCTGLADYGTPVQLPSSIGSTWVAKTTNSFTDITGGNAHQTSYSVSIPTSIDLIAPGAGTVGTPITLRAQLIDNQGFGVSGRTLYFYQNSVQFGSGVTNSGGWATLTFTPTSTGTFTYYAQFNGDATYRSSTSGTATTVIIPIDFSISLNPNSVSITQGGGGSVTATLTLVSATTASVSFSFSGQPSGVTLSAPSCSPTCSSTVTITVGSSVPIGTHTINITATGGGRSRSATLTLTVTASIIPTSIDLLASSYSINLGSSTSLQAQLIDNHGMGVSGKLITFKYGLGTVIGSATTQSGGWATVSWTPPSSGSYQVYAVFAGDSSYASSTSNTVVVQVFDFSISGSPSSGSVTQGSGISTTLTVTWLGGASTPVSLSAAGLPTGTTASFSPSSCTPTCSSTLTFTTSTTTPAGTYPVTITGTAGSLSHPTTYTLTVTPLLIPTAVDLIGPGAGTVGTPITLSAQLFNANTGVGIGAETLTFYQGSSVICTKTTNSGGWAQCTFTPSTAGTFTYYAQFSGDSTYGPSTSNVLTIVIGAGFDFSISVSPGSVTVAQGAGGSVTATLALLSGSTSSVAFSFSGQPSGVNPSAPSCSPSCSSTVSVTVGSSVPTGAYTITVTGTGGGQSHSSSFTLTVTAAGYQVTFTESGLSSGTSWCVTFGSFGQQCQSAPASVVFSPVAPGTYSYSVTYPGCGTGCRYSPSPSSGSLTVSGNTGQGISFTLQYQLTMLVSGAGSVSPGTGWYNAGTVVTITATPAVGCHSFQTWTGSGAGSYGGTNDPATVTMNGAITETAYFNNFC